VTERTGFDSEPTYPLAEQAENQVLRERLYAVQNALVRLEGERDGKVLVDPEDLRAILTCADFRPMQWSQALQATVARLADAAGLAQ
jgi:hypothetical protein